MANRHLARSTVLQTLYEWDFGGKKIETEKNKKNTLNKSHLKLPNLRS